MYLLVLQVNRNRSIALRGNSGHIPAVDGQALIRSASKEEAPLLADLIVAAFSPYRARLVPESGALAETPTTIAQQMAGGTRGAIAEVDAVPAGCVLFKPEDDDVYLSRLAVLPDHRHRGMARLLIAHVEAQARALGARTVSLGVRVSLPDNQRLFLACGYREISRSAHPGFTEPTSIEMRKWL